MPGVSRTITYHIEPPINCIEPDGAANYDTLLSCYEVSDSSSYLRAIRDRNTVVCPLSQRACRGQVLNHGSDRTDFRVQVRRTFGPVPGSEGYVERVLNASEPQTECLHSGPQCVVLFLPHPNPHFQVRWAVPSKCEDNTRQFDHTRLNIVDVLTFFTSTKRRPSSGPDNVDPKH